MLLMLLSRTCPCCGLSVACNKLSKRYYPDALVFVL